MTLQQTIDEKDQKIAELEGKLAESKSKLAVFTEQMQCLLRAVYGKKREKAPVYEGELLDWDDSFAKTENEEAEPEEIESPKPRRKTRKKQEYGKFLEGLPEEREIIDLSDAEKEGLTPIGEDVVKRLAYKPAVYYVKVKVIKKYGVPNKPDMGVIMPFFARPAIPGSLFDESFYAYLLILKFCDHLPLFRIEKILKRYGLELSRQTMSQAILRLAKILSPIYSGIRDTIIDSKNCHLDETTVKQLSKGACKTGYFWTLVGTMYNKGGPNASPPLVYYRYIPNRKHENASELLGENFQGKFHSDAYQAYEKMASEHIVWQPCWAHARRNFFDSMTAHPIRAKVVGLMDKLFEKEREFWKLANDLSIDATTRLDRMKRFRQRNCKPLADKIFSEIDTFRKEGQFNPKEKIVKACDYMLGRKAHFLNFLTHTDLRIDNNVCERSIRPLTIGRKNWLFVGSEEGGKATAIISTLIQCCKNLDINPEEYLTDVLRKINNTPAEKISELYPQNWKK